MLKIKFVFIRVMTKKHYDQHDMLSLHINQLEKRIEILEKIISNYVPCNYNTSHTFSQVQQSLPHPPPPPPPQPQPQHIPPPPPQKLPSHIVSVPEKEKKSYNFTSRRITIV
jgi:hypothetical protein